uniref:Uncharacterized protein n=1 Tax=Meloidogyne enterolobii TaxID=390850 RepID=A0A6V7UIR1_MELEN|nr:unnamed protein product [Meloidogyne enterolobii]
MREKMSTGFYVAIFLKQTHNYFFRKNTLLPVGLVLAVETLIFRLFRIQLFLHQPPNTFFGFLYLLLFLLLFPFS